VGRRILVGVRTEKEVDQLFERDQTMLLEHRMSGFPKLVPGAFLPMLQEFYRQQVPDAALAVNNFAD
jgi:hypothetical protein